MAKKAEIRLSVRLSTHSRFTGTAYDVVRERDSLGDRQNRLGVGPALSWTALTRFTGLDVGQAIWFVLGGSSSTVAIGV